MADSLEGTRWLDHQEWLRKSFGRLVGADGLAGSGLFVRLRSGEPGLLTARHVITSGLPSGSVEIDVTGSQGFPTEVPKTIRIASKHDAAVVTLKPGGMSNQIGAIEWNPASSPGIQGGEYLWAVGVPGQLKNSAEEAGKPLWTAGVQVLKIRAKAELGFGLLECSFDEGIDGLPSTFSGMSGGPVFNHNRDLVGIIKGEGVPNRNGRLYITPRKSWDDLYNPYYPSDLRKDYMRREITGTPVFEVRHNNWKAEIPSVECTFTGEAFWSINEPSHPRGQYGRITSLRYAGASRFIVNVESIYPLPKGHQSIEIAMAIDSEIRELLSRINYRVIRPTRESLFAD